MPKTRQITTRRLLIALMVLPGCGSYGEIKPLAYEQVKSLYTVCNQKNAEQLDRVAERIITAHKAGQLSSEEANWLEAIVDKAHSGHWQVAAAECLRLMEAQVKY